ncbi:MAG TPA: hypothetical protein PK990_01760 [Salinivirgaceae bacterium]|nr:hypothetical protein [Salinivirgaceae bacterium]
MKKTTVILSLIVFLGSYTVHAQKNTKQEKKQAAIEAQKANIQTVPPKNTEKIVQNPTLENQVPIDNEWLYNKIRQLTPSTWNYPGDSVRHYGVPIDELSAIFGYDSKGKMGVQGKLIPEIQNELNLTLIWVLSNKIEELKLENESLRTEIQILKDNMNMVQSFQNDVMSLQTDVVKFREYENRILDLATKLSDLINDINTLKQERRY